MQQVLFDFRQLVLQAFQIQGIVLNERFQQGLYQIGEGAASQRRLFQRLHKGQREAAVLDQDQTVLVQIEADLLFRKIAGGAPRHPDNPLSAVTECLELAGRVMPADCG